MALSVTKSGWWLRRSGCALRGVERFEHAIEAVEARADAADHADLEHGVARFARGIQRRRGNGGLAALLGQRDRSQRLAILLLTVEHFGPHDPLRPHHLAIDAVPAHDPPVGMTPDPAIGAAQAQVVVAGQERPAVRA